MKALIDIIAESISGLVYLSIILGVVIYTLSVIGMNLFQNEYAEYYDTPETMPRWNYQDFYHSFILLFRILCGEWIELLYETLNATDGNQWPVIFYLGALVLGNFLVLNLFLALLLNAFGEESIKEKSGAAAEANDGNVSLTQKIKNKIFNIRKKKHKLASEIRMSSLALSPADHMKSPCKHRGKPNGNPSDVDGTNNNNNNKADNDHDADECKIFYCSIIYNDSYLSKSIKIYQNLSKSIKIAELIFHLFLIRKCSLPQIFNHLMLTTH